MAVRRKEKVTDNDYLVESTTDYERAVKIREELTNIFGVYDTILQNIKEGNGPVTNITFTVKRDDVKKEYCPTIFSELVDRHPAKRYEYFNVAWNAYLLKLPGVFPMRAKPTARVEFRRGGSYARFIFTNSRPIVSNEEIKGV
jgi:hypothetical protein